MRTLARLLCLVLAFAGAASPAVAGISLRVLQQEFSIGSMSFFNCFASTVSVNLEGSRWGTRFPILLNRLYKGGVTFAELPGLQKELTTIQVELRKYPPSKVVWDIKRPGALPPWGNNISPEITNLSNYFVTDDGKDLFGVLFHAISEAEHARSPMNFE